MRFPRPSALDVQKVMHEMFNDAFNIDHFQRLGKANDYKFQALAFLGQAGGELSLARTIIAHNPQTFTDSSINEELREIQKSVEALQEKIRLVAR